MKKHIYHFNLIEIVLTVAVIAFGVVVVLGMLPRGLSITRESGIISYSSEVVDQLGSYLQLYGTAAMSSDVMHTEDEEKDLAEKYANGNVDTVIRGNYLNLIKNSYFESSGDFQRTNISGVYKYNGSNTTESDVYVIALGNTVEIDGETETKVDFSGIIRVWMRPREVHYTRIKHKGTSEVSQTLPADHDCFKEGCDGDVSNFFVQRPDPADSGLKGGIVCMELSYPLSKPYAERTKQYYSFEVDK